MADLHDRLGRDCVLLERVADSVFCLKVAEKQRVLWLMDEMEERFPQIFLCVFLAEVPATLSLAEFGFWLCNHAAVTEVDFTRPNENGIFLILDIHGKRASFATGYLIEQFLPESAQEAALKKGAEAWEDGRMADGIEACFTELDKGLRKAARRFATPVGARVAPVEPSPLEREQLGLKSIRDGHKMPESDAEPFSDAWWEGKD